MALHFFGFYPFYPQNCDLQGQFQDVTPSVFQNLECRPPILSFGSVTCLGSTKICDGSFTESMNLFFGIYMWFWRKIFDAKFYIRNCSSTHLWKHLLLQQIYSKNDEMKYRGKYFCSLIPWKSQFPGLFTTCPPSYLNPENSYTCK